MDDTAQRADAAAPAWRAWVGRWFWWLVGLGALVTLSGLHLELMEPDAALYATIARSMAQSGNWLDLVARGEDWLDKPHLPFWVTALSFRVFGTSAWAYKLPALPFFALALVYTFLFARRFYGDVVAKLAVLFVLFAQHLVLSNNDVRAEPYLLGPIIASLYHFIRAQERTVAGHLVGGAFFGALAMMTKGPFVMLPVAGGLVWHWARCGQWRQALHPRWLLAGLLLLVFITPELYALYRQFDAHPEKVVFGQTGVSGVRFFFWDSQFGRFLNTGPIRGKGDPSFFLHTLLWAFLPWSLWFYAALGSRLRRNASPRRLPEYYALGASLLTLVVFSLSRFQLPHYTNILFPFFAIIAAAWVVRLERPSGWARFASWAQALVVVVYFAASVLLLWVSRPSSIGLGLGVLVCAAGVVAALALFRRDFGLPGWVGRSVIAAATFSLLLNGLLYPEVLRYQAGVVAAQEIEALPERPLGLYGINSYALEWRVSQPVHRWELSELQRAASDGPVHLFFPQADQQALEDAGLDVTPLRVIPHFPPTRLNGRFLNPRTREAALRPMVLAEVRTRR